MSEGSSASKKLKNVLFLAALAAVLVVLVSMTVWYWRGDAVAGVHFLGPGTRSVTAHFDAGEVRVSMPLLRLSGHRGHPPSELTIRARQAGSVVASASCDPDAPDKPSMVSTETEEDRRYDYSVLPDCNFTLPAAGHTELRVTLDLPRALEVELEFKQ